MPRVGFEPTTPVLERTKTVHALDRAAAVIDIISQHFHKLPWSMKFDSSRSIDTDIKSA
jgi:hypothetical protein